MKQIAMEKLADYVERTIPEFHRNRIERLKRLRLKAVLNRKNPYLFKSKHITTAGDFTRTILEAHLSSQEETMFGTFLEGLAIFVCSQVYQGRKSSAEGIDLEFKKDGTKFIVSIKSGPNWGNSSQIKKMKDNFRQAKRILGTNVPASVKVIAVNGCCYGRSGKTDKGEYLKLCGQRFWTFVSGSENLYTDIVEPLGYKAKEKNEQFMEEYAKVVNKFSLEFMKMYCDPTGKIHWEKVVQFNSGVEQGKTV